ncbi:MAG TPA: hypothetical protein VHQ23_01410 [Ilumatobacteraceae bacterium]|nr:hypothetical protein [Ilumatobacteraceae bacterium]
MTSTLFNTAETATDPFTDLAFDTAATDGYDFYREIHKGIRYAMHHATIETGRLDVADNDQIEAVLSGITDLFDLLHLHHHHEDVFVQPLIEAHAPDLAMIIAAQHTDVDDGIDHLGRLCQNLASVGRAGRQHAAHRLYLDLTRLAGAYLTHQLVEETEVMPRLRAFVPTEKLLQLDMELRASVPPPVMADVMAFMLPAMNIEERVDMLTGMSMAPPQVFAVLRRAARNALPAADWNVIADRLGLK